MKHIVVLTGAGISAESGIKTFRDTGGLWEGYDVMEVASPEGFKKKPELVLDFYNQHVAEENIFTISGFNRQLKSEYNPFSPEISIS